MQALDSINKAIAAHGAWKQRLLDAIETGQSDKTPDQAVNDHGCDFGQWLFGTEIDPSIKSSAEYPGVVDLHRQFHAEASRILGLALSGKKEEAKQSIMLGSEYSKLSSALVQKLIAWEKTIS